MYHRTIGTPYGVQPLRGYMMGVSIYPVLRALHEVIHVKVLSDFAILRLLSNAFKKKYNAFALIAIVFLTSGK
jgi:hypothetical protein